MLRGKKILITAFPKSASTYISNVIASYTGYEIGKLTDRYGRKEQDIFTPLLKRNFFKNQVIQQHVRGIPFNIEMINKYKIDGIILVRNIYDSVISFKDHLDNHSISQPMFYFDEEWKDLSDTDKYDIVIQNALPWYSSFFTSWSLNRNTSRINTFMTYENMIADKEKFFLDCLQIMNFQHIDSNRINNSINLVDGKKLTANLRFNVGKVGRGAVLSTEQKSKIEKIVAIHPKVDYSLIFK